MRDDTQLLQTLASHQVLYTFESGSYLFRENDATSGVYVLLAGQVDLHFSGRNGDKPLQLVEPGTILGLSSLMSGRPQEYTAAAATTVVAGFLTTDTFFRVLNEQPELWLNVLRILSRDISSCYDRVRELALPPSRHHEARA